jgi:hypothetical protein
LRQWRGAAAADRYAPNDGVALMAETYGATSSSNRDLMNRLVFCFLLLCSSLSAHAQGTFRNLDFGLNQVPSSTPPGTSVSTAQALPFWSAYIGGVQQSSVTYNLNPTPGAQVSLISPDSLSGPIIPGGYGVSLSAALLPNGSSTSIAQTGQFPVWAGTLQFVASGQTLNTDFWGVTVNGMNIPVFEKSQIGLGLYLYQGDISAFAGQTAELRFSD